MVTAEQIDQAISFSNIKTIDDMHHDLITVLAQHTAQRGQNIRSEISTIDFRRTGLL